MTRIRCAIAALGLAVAAGCGGADDKAGAPDVQAAPPAGAVTDHSGTYRVHGRTVDKESGEGRELHGTIILAQQGSAYTSTFDLETQIPTPEGEPTEAELLGKGEGSVSGNTLEGTSQTQIVWAAVSGLSSDFAFAPRRYGPRLTSKSTAKVQPDGSISIQIESQAQPGEKYRPTRTTLKGRRVKPTGD
jgi:hypothetical protein